MKSKKSAVQKLYERYEYLAHNYARKIILSPMSPLEYDDILQELKIKVWTSIKSYINKWKYYKETGNMKPVPIQFYMMTAMLNKCRDIIKDITKNPAKHGDRLSFESVDVGYMLEKSDLDLKNERYSINGFDLTSGLSGKQKQAFILWMNGYSQIELCRMFKNQFDVMNLIKTQRDMLYSNKRLLVPITETRIKMTITEQQD